MLRIILLWLLTCIAAWLGWKAGKLDKSRATLFAGCSCSLLALGGLLAKNISWLPESLICAETVSFQYAWFTPPAAFLFFLAARQNEISAHRNARVVKLFILLLLMFSTFRLADQQGWLINDLPKTPLVSNDGTILQTTSSTCGAASCANLLRRLKIDEQATEFEMVHLCQTGVNGSTPLGMAAGLKSVAAPQGWHVKILQCDAASLMKLQRPAVISVGTPLLAHHAVMLVSLNEKEAKIVDPISGVRSLSLAEFRETFTNEAVVLYKRDPFEPIE